MRRQLIFIVFCVVMVAAAAGYILSWPGVAATLLGGSIILINVLLQHWALRKAERQARANAEHNLRILMRCAIERFVVTIALFALGMGVWKLPPLALIAGFIVALAGQYVAGPNSRT
ncbi:ATP synthase subunit I [Sulfuriflexus mobilis]|uniref:ATP synthase subunit I n=1 Tax=Sulfuriflexus mobilis TaxID=1811807 RepID=UPI000F81B199|nr:ATP synthase subunit I [Sulfuriflexus mobilis]